VAALQGLLAFGLLAALLVACGGDDGDAPPTSTQPATSPIAATASPTPGRAEETPAGVSDEPVAFMTPDGVTLHGHFYADAGPRRKVVVLAHMFESDQTAWSDFASELAGSGVHTLTFDFRGHGESEGSPDASTTPVDLGLAVLFAQSRDYTEVYVVGASVGGLAALRVAADQELAGVATVSAPPLSVELGDPSVVANVMEPKLFIATRGDQGGAVAEAVEGFVALSTGPTQSHVFEEASEHGTDILTSANGPALGELLRIFIGAA
jgi:pimeloyl-ACP methyl ester carboxylesterase